MFKKLVVMGAALSTVIKIAKEVFHAAKGVVKTFREKVQEKEAEVVVVEEAEAEEAAEETAKLKLKRTWQKAVVLASVLYACLLPFYQENKEQLTTLLEELVNFTLGRPYHVSATA